MRLSFSFVVLGLGLFGGLLQPVQAQQPITPRPAPATAPATKPAAKPTVNAGTKPTTKPTTPAGTPLPANLGGSDFGIRYKNAVVLIGQSRYELALQELAPLTAPTTRFDRAPEAAYLYAVAASRLKKWAEAEQMLNQLRSRHPQWPALPDALFLQGQLSFEQADYDNALLVLSQMPAAYLAPERENMKLLYLPRIRERAQLQQLAQKYPQDAALGRVYADKLANGGWYTEADRALLDQLVSRFGLDRGRYTPRRAARKSTYNIGILLPFEFNDPSWETRRRNQFVTDLYAGLRLAQDSLQREGHPVQLFAYDTGADTTQLKQVLAQPELAGLDMLIGPVYKSGARLLARFAQQNQVITINPLSQDGDLVLDNAWHYLFEPSTATQGRQAAQFAFEQIGGARTALIVHDDTRDETAFAQAYKQAYEALGGKVQMRRLSAATDDAVLAALATTDLKTLGHLVVASDGKQTGPATLQALKAQDARLPLLTYASWLDNNRINLGMLDARDVYFVQPKYLDRSLPGVRRFRQLYTQRQNLPPSVFAFSGFELLYYFGNILHQYGPGFQQPLSSNGPVSGTLFSGIGYPGGAHDNQYVPITKLERMELEVLNPVGLR